MQFPNNSNVGKVNDFLIGITRDFAATNLTVTFPHCVTDCK